ncbi:diguanylate cyclase [Tahibacter sp.]|uniref:diguanylate cyclase domain-containing protein n=1 Tax=Tahibacter sp. TaxID=2056211 RepID=UPI0028C48FB1|nr:diguanylate cyclase [Tahibacter sp.]
MNDLPDRAALDAMEAALELAAVRRQTHVAREMLARLRQTIMDAMNAADSHAASPLRAVNQQLVCSALQAQADADDCNRSLGAVSRAAEHDALTELPNRVLFRDRLEQAIAQAHRHGTRLAVLFVDLNQFKQINDTLGHAIGDQVLQRTAHSLAACIRDSDTVSHHGGDEFLVLLTDVKLAVDAVTIADNIAASLGAPSRIGHNVIRLSASIGISLYPDDGDQADVLIDRADAAMYLAKRHGVGRFVSHGALLAGKQPAPALATLRQPPNLMDRITDEPGYDFNQLREANEQLIKAAISAQISQGDAELAQRQQIQFLALLAHELRSPLGPIRMAANLMGRLPAPELPRMQAIIEREIGHMTRLVGDLLDVGRINSGKMNLERQTVSLKHIVEDAVNACRPAMEARMQHLDVRLPSSPVNMQADPVRLAQVVRNLLDNASKYTRDRGHITLSLVEPEGSAVLTVADDGIGIAAEALLTIFDPYVQEKTAVSFNRAGLGIGLAVVRELVEAHGGTVVATSAGCGKGSQFVVTLPRHEEAAPADELQSGSNGGSPRVH